MKKRSAAKAKQKLPRRAARRVARMIRVNHAGEFGAQRIYAGQLAVLGKSAIAPLLRYMAKQEDEHLTAFEHMMVTRGVRPSVLHPLWRMGGYTLGYVTARLGEKAALACTVAVEEVIDAHYRRQLETLADMDEKDLARAIRRFRAEEKEHETAARDAGAEDAAHYPLLRTVIRTVSKTAIWLAERV